MGTEAKLVAACEAAMAALHRAQVEMCCYPDHDIGAVAEAQLAERQCRAALAAARPDPQAGIGTAVIPQSALVRRELADACEAADGPVESEGGEP